MYDQKNSSSKKNENNLLIRMISITFVKEYSGKPNKLFSA